MRKEAEYKNMRLKLAQITAQGQFNDLQDKCKAQ